MDGGHVEQLLLIRMLLLPNVKTHYVIGTISVHLLTIIAKIENWLYL